MRLPFAPFVLLAATLSANAQQTLSLEECRNMALQNNHEIKAAQAQTQNATYTQKSYRANYLPSITLNLIDSYMTITPQDGDGGFASSKFYGYSEEGQTESLISPRMAVDDAQNVKVSFYYWNAVAEAFTNELKLSVSRDGGDWETVLTTKPLAEGMPQWEQFSKVLSVAGTSDLRIKLDAVRHDGPIANVTIDNISVEATTETGISSVVTGNDSQARTDYFTVSGSVQVDARLCHRPAKHR